MLGDSKPLHLIRATAYGQRHVLAKAAAEWRAALKFTPDDPALALRAGRNACIRSASTTMRWMN